MYRVGLFAALILVALVPEAPADGCRTARFNYPVHYPVSYAAPVVYEAPPVIHQQVIVTEILAPAYVFQVLNAFTPPAAQASSGPAYTQPYQAMPPAAPAAQTVRFDPGQLEELARLIRGGSGGPVAAEDGPPAFADALPAGTTAPPGRDASADEIAALRYFGTACSRCHQGVNARGGVRLFDDGGYWRPAHTSGAPLALADIVRSVAPGSGTMPKDSPGSMPSDLYARVSHWHNLR